VPTPPTGTHSQKKLGVSCPSFFRRMLIVQGVFAVALQACICHAFIKLTHSHPLLAHSLSPRYPNSQQHTVQCIIFCSYIDGLFQCFLFL
jgi:hypothetical protein